MSIPNLGSQPLNESKRMATQMAIKRLTNDYKDLQENPIANISVKVRISTTRFLAMNNSPFQPDPQNILHCHYCIQGPKDSVYEGGYYYGEVIFPIDFPFKPPTIHMMTPSGRFDPRKSIW